MTAARKAVLLAVVLAVLLVLVDLARTSTNPLNLVQPGLRGPSIEVFEEDFPNADVPDSTGLDGQQFYAIARNPYGLDETAEHLDRPRYRLQRPLLSWLAWLGHPTGGGTGLIASLFAVGVLSVGLLAAAVAAVSRRLGAPVWTAALVGIFPGVWWSLRVTTADTLATALGMASIALLLHRRTRWAMVAGALAVLAKETAILILIGWALGRWRDWIRWYPVLAAGVIGAGWALFLRLQLPGEEAVGELTLPLAGLLGAVRDRWLEGDELLGLLGTATALAVAVAALVRSGLRHPLGPAIVVQMAFLSVTNADVIGNDFGSARAMLPLLTLGTIAVLSPAQRRLIAPSQGDSGIVGPGRVSGGSTKR